MKGSWPRAVFLLVAATLSVAGFQPVGAQQPDALVVELTGEPDTFDPALATGRLSQVLQQNIYDSLTYHDERGRLQPSLATSWEMVDRNTWRFKLRQGVRFQNGEEFNAEAVKFTIERILDPATRAYSRLRIGPISGVRVSDPYTVDIVTREPDVLLPVRLSELYGGIVPPRHVQQVGAEFSRRPVGTGPFKLEEWVRNERIVLVANENYWRGAPKVKRIVLRPVVEDAARIAGLLRGEIHLAANIPPINVAEVERSGRARVSTVPSTRFYFVVLDTTKPPLNDRRVRQALNYGVNVEAIVNSVGRGYGTRLATIIIPEAFGYDPNVTPYPYDPAEARRLLAEAGHPNGFEIDFDSFTGSIIDHSRVGEAVVGQLGLIGVRVRRLNVTEFGVFSPRRIALQTAPMYIYSYGEWAFDADNTYSLFLLPRPAGGYYYTNPEMYAKYQSARGTLDSGQRRALLQSLQRDFKQEAPFIFLYQVHAIWGMTRNVNYAPRVDEMMWFYTAAWR